jgi:hypothetical protein
MNECPYEYPFFNAILAGIPNLYEREWRTLGLSTFLSL